MRFESVDRARAVVKRSVDHLEVFRLVIPSVAEDLVVLALQLVALGISDGYESPLAPEDVKYTGSDDCAAHGACGRAKHRALVDDHSRERAPECRRAAPRRASTARDRSLGGSTADAKANQEYVHRLRYVPPVV